MSSTLKASIDKDDNIKIYKEGDRDKEGNVNKNKEGNKDKEGNVDMEGSIKRCNPRRSCTSKLLPDAH